MRSRTRDVLALKENDAFIGMEKAADEIEDRCLASAVWANDEEDLTCVHCERDILHSAKAAEAFGYIAKLENGRWGHCAAPLVAGCALADGGLARLLNNCRRPPTIPSGMKSTTITIRTPYIRRWLS